MVGRGSSSHDLGGEPMMIRWRSSAVTSLMDDRLQSVEGWCGGGEPSVACRMPKILAVCEVRKSSAVKAGAPEVHSGWTRRRPRRVLNVDHRRLGSLAWEMILSSQYARSFSRYLRCILRTNCTQVRWHSGASKLPLMAASLTPQSATFLVKPRTDPARGRVNVSLVVSHPISDVYHVYREKPVDYTTDHCLILHECLFQCHGS